MNLLLGAFGPWWVRLIVCGVFVALVLALALVHDRRLAWKRRALRAEKRWHESAIGWHDAELARGCALDDEVTALRVMEGVVDALAEDSRQSREHARNVAAGLRIERRMS